MKKTTTQFSTEINFNSDFDEGKELVTVTLDITDKDNIFITESDHKLGAFDERFIVGKYTGKY